MGATATTTEAWHTPLGARLTRWMGQYPEPPQEAFLWLDCREALYGGAAGGGKSSALLAAALQYADVPGYSALLLRRTFPDLNLPDALIPRAHEWLSNTDATWNDNDHRWTFPSGATLTFGFLELEKHKYRYQGAAFQFIGFDELTQFTETQYRYLFSRLRRLEGSRVPTRMRAASNPGGVGHEWVKTRFGLGDAPAVLERAFIPARLDDNPHLDAEDYEGQLQELDHHTRRQLRDGNWDAKEPGDLFRRSWFPTVDQAPEGCRWIRFWDMAATEPSTANPDPDWTVGLRMGKHPNGAYFIEHVKRLRAKPKGVETAMQDMATRDGTTTTVRVEQEPGSSGKTVVDNIARVVLPASATGGHRSTGSKFDRARPVSSKAEHGLIHLVAGEWHTAFLDELEAFAEDPKLYSHDDQVDAMSGAFESLNKLGTVRSISGAPAIKPPVTIRGDLVLTGEKYIDKT